MEVENNAIYVTYGLVDGESITQVTYAEPKNIGKINETTAEEQALLEAESKWNYQKNRQGYVEDLSKARLEFRPMLALDYTKVPHRVKWREAMVQPKLDGLRMFAGVRYIEDDLSEETFEMFSRKGIAYEVEHMREPCLELLGIINDITKGRCKGLDGELYIHGVPLQTITSYARRFQEGKTTSLKFYIFDLYIPGARLIRRVRLLHRIERIIEQEYPHLQDIFCFVRSYICPDEATLIERHDEFKAQGYEGAMLRHGHSEYDVGKRSPNLFKVKTFHDKECLIIGMIEDKNGNAVLTCLWDKDDESSVFNCTPKRTHDERKEMLANRNDFIGSWITVKYQAVTKDGLPQFPVGLAIRQCDENGDPIL